jgi:hypothetical protein
MPKETVTTKTEQIRKRRRTLKRWNDQVEEDSAGNGIEKLKITG